MQSDTSLDDIASFNLASVLFCKNKLLSNLTKIEQFPWRKLFWMAFGSDHVSEKKLSSKVLIQPPQTEKLNWLGKNKKKKKVWNCSVLSTLGGKKRIINEICNSLAQVIVNESVVDIFLKRNCSCTAHAQKHPFWLLLFVLAALPEFPWSTVLAVSHLQSPRPKPTSFFSPGSK